MTGRTTSESSTVTAFSYSVRRQTAEAPPPSGQLSAQQPAFCVSREDLAGALARLSQEAALAIDLVSEGTRQDLLAAARGLAYRPARAVIGEGDKQVHQDFELTLDFRPGDLFHRFAEAFSKEMAAAAGLLPVPPLSRDFWFNDLILQRYPPGCGGITPHRDHLCYRELVALVCLCGDGNFFLCDDRAGKGARSIPVRPGSVLLMVAPGFPEAGERPFHALREISAERYSLGLRYDSRGRPEASQWRSSSTAPAGPSGGASRSVAHPGGDSAHPPCFRAGPC